MTIKNSFKYIDKAINELYENDTLIDIPVLELTIEKLKSARNDIENLLKHR